MTWLLETVATGAGTLISIEVDSAGNPWILYQTNIAGGGINLAHWNGSAWSVQRVVEGIGYCLSLALDGLDRPRFVHDFDDSPFPGLMDMHYTYWNGTSWVNETIDSQGDFGGSCSLALDSLGRPHVSYADFTTMSFDLKYAWRDATTWHNETVDPQGWTGIGNSIALDSLDRPHIAYEERNNVTVMHAWWDGSLWDISIVDSSKQAGLEQTSIGLDSLGGPHIAYLASINIPVAEDRYASWNGFSWQNETAAVIGSIGFGYPVSLRLDTLDRPSMAFRNISSLSFASESGGFWTTEVVDPGSMVGTSVSLALDTSGNPHIAYVDGGSDLLRHAHRGVDSSPPSSFVEPIVPYWASSPRVITATASDIESRVVNVTLWFRFSTDNGSFGPWTPFGVDKGPPWSWLSPFPNGEGFYRFYSIAADAGGNVEPPPSMVDAIAGYDITTPVSAAMPISPYWHTFPSILVNATARDNLSGVASVTLLYSHAPLDNSSWSPWTPFGTGASPPWSWQFPFPDGEGNYKFHTVARDVAGNDEGSKTTAEAIAGYRVPPDYILVNPSPPSPTVVGLSLPLRLSVEIENGGGSTDTTATLAFYNESSRLFPFASIQVPPIANGSASGPLTTSWTSPASPCSCRVIAEMDYYNSIAEWDETNNNHTWTINVVTGPVTSLVIGNPNYTSTATHIKSITPLDLSVFDQGGTGINHTWYRIDNVTWTEYSSSFFLSGDGDHYVEWFSEDNAGNIEVVSWRVLRVDDTPPATSILVCTPRHQAGELYVTSSTGINLTSADGGAVPVGLARTEYQVDGGGWLPYSSNITLAGADGPRMIEYRSVDLLGNSEEARNITVILDDTAPATTISPATSQVESGTHFTIGATDLGSGVNHTEYRVDGGGWTTYTDAFTLSEGDHNITYRSVDNLGNLENEKYLDVTVHGPSIPTQPPSVEANYKPLVALVFAVILAVVGVWSSKKKPWKGGKDRMAVAKAFVIMSLPFVLAEAATGIVSFMTGELSIPPLLGLGTALDFAIFMSGLVVTLLSAGKQGKEEHHGE